jgi:outer membrane receptor for ferrienterochelin and colicins
MKYNFHPRFTFSSGVYFLSKSKISDLNSYFNSTDYSFDFNYKNLKYLFRMSAYYKYTDDWYTSGRELTKTGEERIIDGFMKGYSTLNITLSRPFFKNRFDCAIGGKNLFNNTSVISKGIGQGGHNGGGGNSPVGWGRTFFIKVTYNFLKT